MHHFGFGLFNSERFLHKEREVSVSGIQHLQGLGREALPIIVSIPEGTCLSSLNHVEQLLIQQPILPGMAFRVLVSYS